MRDKIHPKTQTIKARCSCGAEFEVESTLEKDIELDVCSQCHPFYTGKQNMIDTAGRVDKFKERMAKSAALKGSAKEKAPRKKNEKEKRED